jgi:hypothetical protein
MSQVPPSGAPRPVARPPLVTAAAAVLFVAGGLQIINGLIAFGLAGFGGIFLVVGILGILVGAAAIYAGIQVMALREQGRMIGLIVAGVGALFALIAVFGGAFLGILPLLGYGFVIYVLVTQAGEFNR